MAFIAPNFSDIVEMRDKITGVIEYSGFMIVSFDTIKVIQLYT